MFGILSVISTVFMIVFAILMLLFIGIGVLRGLSKGLVSTVIRIVNVLIAGLLAIPVSKLIGKALSGLAMGFINSFLSDFYGSLGVDIFELSPTLESIAVGLPAVVISALIYVFVFLIIFLLLLIPIHFIKKLIDKRFPKLPAVKWAGALCGIISGLAVFVFVFSPLVGTLTLVNDTASVFAASLNVENAEDEEEINIYEDAIKPITGNFLVRFTSNIGAKAIFNSLTVIDVADDKTSLSKEMSVMADVVSDIVPIMDGDSPDKWTSEDISGIRSAAEKLDGSKLATGLLADIISGASEKWANGEEFLGIGIPTTGRSSVDNLINEIFVSLSMSTSSTISDDFVTFADVFGVMHRYGMFSSLSGGSDGLVDNISREGFVSDVLAVTLENERFRGVTASVINLGVQESLGILNVPENDSEVYLNFLEDIAATLNEANENSLNSDEVKEKIYKNFVDSEIVIERAISDNISRYLMEDFGGYEYVGAEEISGFFAVAFDFEAAGDSDDEELEIKAVSFEASPLYSGAEELCLWLVDIKNKLDAGDESVSGFANVDWDMLFSLRSEKTFESGAVTCDSVLVTKEKINSMTDEEILAECDRIENILQNMIKFSKSLVSEGTDGEGGEDESSSEGPSESILEKADVEALGDAFNDLSDSKMLEDVSDTVISAALQSDIVKNNLSLSDGVINSMLESKDTDYKNILVSFKKTASIINGIGSADSGSSDEKIDEDINWLLNDMTGNTADVMGDVLDTENIKNFGIEEDKAEKISGSVNVFFDKIAESDADTSDPEDEDVAATKALFKFISAAKSTEGNLFEETGLSPEKTVSVFMSSEISRETLIAACYTDGELEKDPYGVAGKMTAKDKTEALGFIKDEAAENYESAEDKEEYVKALLAVGAILGVDASQEIEDIIK